MAHIKDLWKKKDGSRTDRYGTGLRWQISYTDNTGHKVRKSYATKDQATAELAAVTVNITAGTYRAPTVANQTLASYWPRLERIKRATSPKNLESYTAPWNSLIRDTWGPKPVRSITASAVREWLAGLTVGVGESRRRLSVSYERKVLICMRSLLELAYEDRVIDRNPLAKVKARPMQATGRRYLSVREADALVGSFVGDRRVLVQIMLHTAVRPGEAMGIKVGDVQLKRRRIVISRDLDALGREDPTKNRQVREVPIGAELAGILKEQIKGKSADAFVTMQENGRPWTATSWRRAWAAACENVGLVDFHMHELRHTGISWAIHAGANVKTIQRMAGHASASITLDVYGHLWDDELDAVPARVGEYLKAERKRLLDHPETTNKTRTPEFQG